MNLHQTEQNNSKSSAVANNIGNQNNSEQGISLMPPEIIFSAENIHEPANELFQLKEDDRKEIPNFLQVWNKNQDNTPIQQKQADKKEPENFVQMMDKEQKDKIENKPNPIYDYYGNLLGYTTDSKGSEIIVMDANDYKNDMTYEKAITAGKYFNQLTKEEKTIFFKGEKKSDRDALDIKTNPIGMEKPTVYRLNSPWFVDYLDENPAFDTYTLIMALYQSNAVFKDGYAESMLDLNDKSVVDLVNESILSSTIIIEGIKWNNPNDHTEGYTIIVLRRYNQNELSDTHFGTPHFWAIEPAYEYGDEFDLIDKKVQALIGDFVGDYGENLIISIAKGVLGIIATPIPSGLFVYKWNELSIKNEAKARLRTLGPDNTVILKMVDIKGNEGVWKLKFVGYDSEENEIWKENSLWFNNFNIYSEGT